MSENILCSRAGQDLARDIRRIADALEKQNKLMEHIVEALERTNPPTEEQR